MREPVDAARLRAFMRALANAARGPLQVYLVVGATAVTEGWRESTIDTVTFWHDDLYKQALAKSLTRPKFGPGARREPLPAW